MGCILVGPVDEPSFAYCYKNYFLVSWNYCIFVTRQKLFFKLDFIQKYIKKIYFFKYNFDINIYLKYLKIHKKLFKIIFKKYN